MVSMTIVTVVWMREIHVRMVSLVMRVPVFLRATATVNAPAIRRVSSVPTAHASLGVSNKAA